MRQQPLSNENVLNSQRLALQVDRYHTWPKLRSQSVGEHTAQVMRIYVRLFGVPPPEVWLAILEHDMPEIQFGDIPFYADGVELKNAKRTVERRVRAAMSLGNMDSMLTDTHKMHIKICDMMDCFEWGHHEMRLGNQYGKVVAENVRGPILTMAAVAEVVDTVKTHMKRVEDAP